MLANRIIPDETPRGKLLAALYLLLSLKYTALGAILGAFLIVALIVFTIILDAIVSIMQHIAQVYASCGPIERLCVFVLLWIFIVKMSPIVARILKTWKGF